MSRISITGTYDFPSTVAFVVLFIEISFHWNSLLALSKTDGMRLKFKTEAADL